MDEKRYYMNTGYENGSVARKLQEQWEQEETRRPRKVEQPELQPKVKIRQGIDLMAVLFLISAIAATLIVCVNYLKVQSDVVQLNKSIAGLEKQIAGLEKENDALAVVLENEKYDPEVVYQMAVGMLGMVYPNNNEVIYYDNSSEGYYRQYQNIPD